MPLLQELESGLLLELAGGGLAEECCCDNCCDEPGGPPTAGFSYSQTDDDPCTFTFTDNSTAGTCGSIVSRLWDFGDGNASTSTNPTHAYSGSYPSGPWDVTLTITDSAGCQDSVVMEVACEDMYQCICCNEDMPATCQVTLSGFSDPAGPADCDACSDINGTYELDVRPLNHCRYRGQFEIATPCDDLGPPPITLTIEVRFDTVGGWLVQVNIASVSDVDHFFFKAASCPQGCRGTHTFAFLSGIFCNVPATVTVIL